MAADIGQASEKGYSPETFFDNRPNQRTGDVSSNISSGDDLMQEDGIMQLIETEQGQFFNCYSQVLNCI